MNNSQELIILRNIVAPLVFITIALVLVGVSGYYYNEYYGKPRCEACGMIITSEMSLNYVVTDTITNQKVYACCPGCMLRVVAAHPNVHIDAFDSWYGTAAPTIQIDIVNKTVTNVSPSSTLIVLGSKISGGCVSNRIAINQTTAQLLVQNGYNTSNPLSPFKTEVPTGAPLMNVSATLTAMLVKGIAYVPPSSTLLIGIIVAGILVLLLGLVAWKKLLPSTAKKLSQTAVGAI
jgi:hypothetical protein